MFVDSGIIVAGKAKTTTPSLCQRHVRHPPPPRHRAAKDPSFLAFLRFLSHKRRVHIDSLTQTLLKLAHYLSKVEDPWWILGSAAVYLKGYDPGRIGDVDVLVSERDAVKLMSRHGWSNDKDGGTERYRSGYVLRPDLGALPVEILANYEILSRQTWKPVCPATRHQVMHKGCAFYVPSDENLVEIFERLARPKDFDRIREMQGG